MSEPKMPTSRPNHLKLRAALIISAAVLMGTGISYAGDAAPANTAPAATATATTPPPIKPDAVIATVGKDTITEADLAFAAEDLGQQLRSVPPASQRAFLVTVLIDMKVMAKAARDEKLDATPDYKMRLKYLEDRALRRAYFAKQVGGTITPDTLKAAYQDYVSKFQPQEQVHAEHILVKTEDEAKAIEKQLAGGASFEELAKSKSIDTGSGANGGDLGFFSKNQMVKSFEDAAFKLEPGKISAPVKSQYGWHIIKVLEKRETKPQAMDKIAPQLQQSMLYKKFNDAVVALKKQIKVTIPDASLAAAVKAQEQAGTAAQ